MKQRIVMTLMYGIEPVGPVSAQNEVDQQYSLSDLIGYLHL
jgi:hypothetical protein